MISQPCNANGVYLRTGKTCAGFYSIGVEDTAPVVTSHVRYER